MTESFEQWALVEIMGHKRFAGRVTEETIGGASFVRIDVPASDGSEGFTKLFGASSIYCISPVTEELARAMATELRSQPVEVYDLPVEWRNKIQASALKYENNDPFDASR